MMLLFEDWKNKTRNQNLKFVWNAFQLSVVKTKTKFLTLVNKKKTPGENPVKESSALASDFSHVSNSI